MWFQDKEVDREVGGEVLNGTMRKLSEDFLKARPGSELPDVY